MSRAALTSLAREGLRVVPKFSFTHHKGSSGRIAVIGGSEDYSGAPYLAGMSALRCGADLVFVLCPPVAAASIKAYCPDFVVRPIAIASRLTDLVSCIEACHSVVIGPGLGTSPEARDLYFAILDVLLNQLKHLHVVLDACALRMLCERPNPVLEPRFLLTPNINEFRLLKECMANHGALSTSQEDRAKQVMCASNFFNASIILKGEQDLVAEPGAAAALPSTVDGWMGSPRRAAGQGDILCGAMGAFCGFRTLWKPQPGEDATPSMMETSAAASSLVKLCARRVFDDPGKSTYIASDLVVQLGRTREELLIDTDGHP